MCQPQLWQWQDAGRHQSKFIFIVNSTLASSFILKKASWCFKLIQGSQMFQMKFLLNLTEVVVGARKTTDDFNYIINEHIR